MTWVKGILDPFSFWGFPFPFLTANSLRRSDFRLLTFNTYDRKIEDEDNNDNSNENNEKNMKYKKKASKEFIVQMFGINEQGKPASIFVEDYLPFFYAKVDNKWKEQDKLEFILKNLILSFL